MQKLKHFSDFVRKVFVLEIGIKMAYNSLRFILSKSYPLLCGRYKAAPDKHIQRMDTIAPEVHHERVQLRCL